MIATTCFLLLFQSALLIHSGKEVTEKVLFSRINQGGSRTKQLLCPRPFSARHWLHGFPRLASVAWFPALGIGCMVSCAWHRLHGFLRLASVFWICLISQALRRNCAINRQPLSFWLIKCVFCFLCRYLVVFHGKSTFSAYYLVKRRLKRRAFL